MTTATPQKIQTFHNTILRRVLTSNGLRGSQTRKCGEEQDRSRWTYKSNGGSGTGLDTIQHHTPSPDFEPVEKENVEATHKHLEERY